MADYANARKSLVEGTEVNKADDGVHSTEAAAPEGTQLETRTFTQEEEDPPQP